MSSRNIFDDNRITLRDIPDLMRFCQRRGRSLMMFGGAGLGKSQAMKRVANMLFGERDDNLIDFRLADKEPSDVVGVQIPVTDDKGVTRTVYAILTSGLKILTGRYRVLDELLHAEPYLQKVAYQIMLDHRIGTYMFPKGAVFAGAGNRPGDGTAVSMLEAPLANRMIWLNSITTRLFGCKIMPCTTMFTTTLLRLSVQTRVNWKTMRRCWKSTPFIRHTSYLGYRK